MNSIANYSSLIFQCDLKVRVQESDSQFILNHRVQNGRSQSSNRSIPVAAARTPKKPAITSGCAVDKIFTKSNKPWL
ncbi:MAG: hypothetical protein QNJ54_26355 [Prochloraceae cyanobacterium]|nr:hypothetical protein [Prochloraceae cyanobacterium]